MIQEFSVGAWSQGRWRGWQDWGRVHRLSFCPEAVESF